MLRTLIATVIFAAVALPVAAQSSRIDVSKLGPQIGERVPTFRLVDQHGALRSLDSLMGPKGAMLVFSRSVDWCPYCKTQVIELQSRVDELKRQGLGVAVITYDSPQLQVEFGQRRGITLPLLSDAGSATIRAFGILNTTVDPHSSNFGIPFPGTFMLDRNGTVTARFFEEAYQERNTVANIILKLGRTGVERRATRLKTEHLEVTTYASDDVVAPGSVFSLVFDVEPRERMHVYAPEADGYKVISVEIDANPLLVMRPTAYPPSEIYFFKPLNERVPVFQKPFRLMQELALTASRDHRATLAKMEALTITGRLNYQACDDKVCYTPVSLPISYSVRVRQLDTERGTSSP
jgi:peroxiredoxin